MKLISGIYKFFDKKIILPITRFFVSIINKIRNINKPLEMILKTKRAIIIMSLGIAVLIFIFVDRRGNLSLENSAEVIYNQKVVAEYNNEQYVVDGLPETVDITIIGSKANLYLAKQLSNQIVTVDLSKLGVGTHQVKLKYKRAVSNVEYKLDPSIVSVTISNKQSVSKEISKEVINLDSLDSKYSVGDISLYKISEKTEEEAKPEDVSNVYIKGTNEQINKVAVVKALINIKDISKAKLVVGENTIKNVPLVAYDETGKKLNIELVPSKVNAVVTLESESKEVPISIVINNSDNIVFGKAIKSITSSVDTVTVYGNSEALSEINKITVEIDIPKDMKSDKTFTKTIKKPNGARTISEKTVNVDVKLGDQAISEVSNVKISYKNLSDDYVVQASADSTTEIPVIIKGVDSVINGISASDIDAYVDLKDLSEGEQTVKVYATGNDNRVLYQPKVTEIKIVISRK